MATAPALAVFLLSAVQAAAQQADPDRPPPVSLERVREGLERPPLILPKPDEMAYFRTTVEGELVIEGVLAAMRRDLAARPGRPIAPPATGYTPLSLGAGIDVLGVARAFGRWRAARDARRTVQESLDEFCAVHDCSVLEPGSSTPEGFIGPGRMSRTSGAR